MKLVSFEHAGRKRFGAIVPAGIIALDDRLGITDGLKAFLGEGRLSDAKGLLDNAPDFELSGVTLLPPIPDPEKIFCVGVNYRDHAQEAKIEETPYPTLFPRFSNTLVASGEAIWRPVVSSALDFEGELAVIVGKGGRHIPEAEALDHVGGYACFNEASVRDWQWHTPQVTPGKNFYRTGGFGPWLVTPDEAPPVPAMRLTTRLNGEVMQDASVGDLIFTVEQLIAYCSQFTLLEPGDIIATGSPAGIGARRTPKLFMKPGDIVEVEITGLGKLVNPIAAEPAI